MYTRNEKITPVYIEDEMRDSYISYAMSVIVGRALPDARDGLKPVHRRILYAMKDLSLEHNKPYKKCARIVGDCLGRYHPHGDMAVYDALVRMAQDFSLRYPLIDGQGNFGCFTKDTKIRLSDGRYLDFEGLIKEARQGKKNYTFTLNPETQKIEIAEIKNPRKTRKNSKIIKVILDNNTEIKCTPDHPFMLRDGTYKAAKDLKPQDSLMPLYIELFDGKKDPNLKGYEVVYQPLKNIWEFVHHIADQWNLANKIYEKSAGKIRHHKDFNKLNNSPDNIQRIQWNQHWELHKEIAGLRHKNDPEYVYKERVLRSRVLGFVGSLLKKNQTITAQLYEQERTTGLPKFENALRHFSDFEDLVYQAKQEHNHKVDRIEIINTREDVYDLTIDPWHNFALAAGVFVHNSVDGDSPAAMRYTEARMEHITDLMLQDIEKDTVKFVPNFDESLEEPSLLPAVLPNLLINGSSGIAVGMATNIPPQNLNEVCDAVAALIDKPDIEIKELMKYIKGPDFPTGGIIRGREGIKSAYTTGRGLLKVHAKASIEEQKSGKQTIIITELPYQVNKANLITSIAGLVRDKKIEGISDVRDESDKDGIRVVIELKRGENAQIILNNLYKHTQMQESFGVIMLALVNGKPQILNLKQLLENYVEHRKDIITRRTKFDLNKALDRAHILEGLKIALDNLDRIIKTIRQSKDPQTAKEALMKNFDLSERQSVAILEMQLQRLTALEREKIDEEYLDLIKKIALYRAILESEKKILEIIKQEISGLKEKFGDPRRTELLSETEELSIEDLIAEEDMVITISHSNYIKRLPVSAYRKQKRGGKGVTGSDMKEEDFIEHLFIASTHDYVLFFTTKGRVYWLKVHEIPEASRQSRGKAIINLMQLEQGEGISAYIPVREFKEGQFLVMATKMGLIKKTALTAFSNPRKGGIIGITIEKDDELIGVKLTDGQKELTLATKEGKAIRFPEEHVRDMGRGAKGVRGIRLGKKDVLIAMEVVEKDATLLTVTDNGFGKRTDFSEYRVQSRGGKGIINIKAGKKNGLAVGVKSVTDKDELMLITGHGMIVRCAVKDIRTTGRSTQGVRLMKLEAKDEVASVARVIPEEEEEPQTG